MKNKMLHVGLTVGYMLKVMKSEKKISKFSKEFAAIRHGDYFDFINQLKEPIPEMVVYSEGRIEVNPLQKKDDIDFIGLFKAGPSLKKFLNACLSFYGNIIDNDIPDIIFYEVSLFELSLRMHANNRKLLNERDCLENVINKISEFHKLTHNEHESLQQGRRFLNMIKHFKQQFESYNDGIIAFKKADVVLKKYKLTIL